MTANYLLSYLSCSNRYAADAAFIEEFENMIVRNATFTLIPTITVHNS